MADTDETSTRQWRPLPAPHAAAERIADTPRQRSRRR